MRSPYIVLDSVEGSVEGLVEGLVEGSATVLSDSILYV